MTPSPTTPPSSPGQGDERDRAQRDAREWMSHLFPGCKIFENRVQSLAAMLKRYYEYGLSDASR